MRNLYQLVDELSTSKHFIAFGIFQYATAIFFYFYNYFSNSDYPKIYCIPLVVGTPFLAFGIKNFKHCKKIESEERKKLLSELTGIMSSIIERKSLEGKVES